MSCHDPASGTIVLSLFVRDADGCTAEWRRPIVRGGSGPGLPELSPPGSPRPLLVSRTPGGLRIAFEEPPGGASLHVGDLATLASAGYSHSALVCGVLGDSAEIPGAAGDLYFLVAAASPCADQDEGSVGGDSFGRERPPAGAATGGSACP